MRNFSLFLLLASTAIPATAAPGDGNRESRRASQSDRSDNRPQRAERSERREARERPQRQIQVERQPSNDAARAAMRERYQQAQQAQQVQSARGERNQRYQQQIQQQQIQVQSSRGERVNRYRQRQVDPTQRVEGGGLVPRQSRIRTIPSTRPEVGQTGPVRHDVRTSGRRYDRDSRTRWTNHWRDDRRYDWRRYRDRNRSVFRIGFYYDPFGYSYRRFGIGSFLYPNYYQSNYWINDPWQYRLPPAYGSYRWVRYHSDALLIDTYSGEVVDVIHGFFW